MYFELRRILETKSIRIIAVIIVNFWFYLKYHIGVLKIIRESFNWNCISVKKDVLQKHCSFIKICLAFAWILFPLKFMFLFHHHHNHFLPKCPYIKFQHTFNAQISPSHTSHKLYRAYNTLRIVRTHRL